MASSTHSHCPIVTTSLQSALVQLLHLEIHIHSASSPSPVTFCCDLLQRNLPVLSVPRGSLSWQWCDSCPGIRESLYLPHQTTCCSGLVPSDAYSTLPGLWALAVLSPPFSTCWTAPRPFRPGYPTSPVTPPLFLSNQTQGSRCSLHLSILCAILTHNALEEGQTLPCSSCSPSFEQLTGLYILNKCFLDATE